VYSSAAACGQGAASSRAAAASAAAARRPSSATAPVRARFSCLALGSSSSARFSTFPPAAIERDLLLRRLISSSCACTASRAWRRRGVRRAKLDANASELVLDFGQPRRGRRFVRARFVAARARRLDGFRQAAIAAANSTFSHAASRRAAACSGGPSPPGASAIRAACRFS
jgi:hypothetical protein